MARLPADLLPCFREESQELTWREIASSTFTRRVRRSAAISVRLTSRVSCQIRHMHRQNVNPSGESGVKARRLVIGQRGDTEVCQLTHVHDFFMLIGDRPPARWEWENGEGPTLLILKGHGHKLGYETGWAGVMRLVRKRKP